MKEEETEVKKTINYTKGYFLVRKKEYSDRCGSWCVWETVDYKIYSTREQAEEKAREWYKDNKERFYVRLCKIYNDSAVMPTGTIYKVKNIDSLIDNIEIDYENIRKEKWTFV